MRNIIYFISENAIVSGLVVAILSWIGKVIFNKVKSMKAKVESIYDYLWVPQNPVRNLEPIRNINEYPKDFKFDFDKGEFLSTQGRIETVEGLECFKMRLIKLVNTEKDKYKVYEGTKYGVSYTFKDVKDAQEFERISHINSADIIDNFKDWIKEIHFIKKYKDTDKIQIGLGMKGLNEILKIDAAIK